VHSGASGVRNVDALFFMLGWARCGFHKQCAKTRYAELVFFFAFGGICRSRIAFQCIRATKHQRTILHARGGPGVVSIKSAPGHVTRRTRLFGSIERSRSCIPVHSGREWSMHYFSCLGGPSVDSIKSMLAYVTPKLCFLIH
jgi:hypothetical protein